MRWLDMVVEARLCLSLPLHQVPVKHKPAVFKADTCRAMASSQRDGEWPAASRSGKRFKRFKWFKWLECGTRELQSLDQPRAHASDLPHGQALCQSCNHTTASEPQDCIANAKQARDRIEGREQQQQPL
jgi:hypothetical protein